MPRRRKTNPFPVKPRQRPAAGSVASPPEQLATLAYYGFQQRRRRKAYRRGDRPRILSSIGYGSPHWVRVFCRVMLSNPEWSKTEYLKKVLRDGVRGWQNLDRKSTRQNCSHVASSYA